MSVVSDSSRRFPRKRAIAGVLLLTLAVAAYVVSTRLTALYVLRWFVDETGIPVEVRAASWNVSWGELFKGTIRELHLDLYYKPLELPIRVDTSANYTHNGKHWAIYLEPVLKIADFPPATGTLKLDLDVERRGRKAQATGAELDIHLQQAKPLLLENASGSLSGESWKIDGDVQWAGEWSSKLKVSAKNFKLEDAAKKQQVTMDWLTADLHVHWDEHPPLPFELDAKINTGPLRYLGQGLFIEEPSFETEVAFHFDGKNFDRAKLSFKEPFALSVNGSYVKNALKGDFALTGDLEKLYTSRVVRWFEGQVALLRRSKAKGTLGLRGSFLRDAGGNFRSRANLALDAKTFELPSKDLFVDNVQLKVPLSYPETPDFGSLNVQLAEFHSVKFKNLALSTRLSVDGIDLTTENSDGDDQPIRQHVWGGAIDIAELYAHLGGPKGTEFTASVKGGPFQLAEIQRDLCVAAESPLAGSLSFNYPRMVQDKDSMHLIGAINLDVFGGKAGVGDLHLFFDRRDPRLRFDAHWSDLDLAAIGEWTRLGDMRGSLEGSINHTMLALTPIGPVPLAYDLTVRGQPRAGKGIRFYGRAVNNIMELLGTRPEELSPIAQALLKVSTWWRNWMPATAEYMGFRAKSDGEWTELSTFDPPAAPGSDRNAKNHYLLYGSAFTIPLNTHGVYPAIMKTDAFHGWVAGMVEYFKGRNRDEQKQKPQCTPLW